MLIIVNIRDSTTLNMFAPFTVLLFVLYTNAISDQSYNGKNRFDKDVDLVGDLLDGFGIKSPIERIESIRKDGKNLNFALCQNVTTSFR